jgi:hypothetical protein
MGAPRGSGAHQSAGRTRREDLERAETDAEPTQRESAPPALGLSTDPFASPNFALTPHAPPPEGILEFDTLLHLHDRLPGNARRLTRVSPPNHAACNLRTVAK